ncbi:hypothetical protein K457DRAFT_1130726 [Linnemannia elongata AG-77]|uniref:Uncharacterized protein n=1 Tax=Linnemannia elongata AG-77 TaxID=1314771 RepID=A0A197JC62_9FUNG|nr:hypothetical protein K457DRAFT_1130726 [Linnemannia elongata AG-77]
MGCGYREFRYYSVPRNETASGQKYKILIIDKNEPSQYIGFWANVTTREMGARMAFLVKESWQKHFIKRNTHKVRGISLDFGYHLGGPLLDDELLCSCK